MYQRAGAYRTPDRNATSGEGNGPAIAGSRIRKRDVGILLVCILGGYFQLQREGSFSYTPAFFYPHEGKTITDLTDGERLPPPIVTDLQGDGNKQVIIPTKSKLVVLDPNFDLRVEASPNVAVSSAAHHETEHNFLEGRVLREVSLLPAMVRVAVGRRPVALAAGHIDPPPAPPAPIWAREQVIVVVTESWNLMCFNSALTLLWEVSLQQFFPEGSHQREIALLVTNHTMKADGSRGTVFVGGSMNTVHKYQEETADEMLADDQQRESKVHGNAHGDKERLRNHKPRKEDRHFMYFAFAASSGHMMWRHTAKDFHKSDVDLRDQLIPQHNYRLDAASLEGQRVGEVSCRDYAESMMHALPHQWSSRGDTRFELLHFKKHKHHRKRDRAAAKASGIEQGNNKISDTLARTAKVVGDTAMGHNRNKHHHNLPEHLRNPNAIVAHLQDGIEVIHMYSGRPICFLSLEPDTLHADINRDGVVDHLRSYGNSESAQHYHTERHGHDAPYACSGVVTSGVHHEMLFNVSVCRSKFGMDSHMPSRAFGRTADGMSPLEVAAPVPVPHSGHVSSAADVVFLNSRGEVTLVDQHGTKKWQHSMGCHWSNPRLPNGAVASHVIPSLQPLRAHKNSHVSAILSVGESKAAVVALHGSRLQTLKLPSAPAAKAVIADFTGDGFNDLLISTHDGYYAFAQQRHAGAVVYSVLLGMLFLSITVVYITNEVGAPKGKSVQRTKRSTD